MLPEFQIQTVGGSFTFQQDKDPKYSQTSQEWFGQSQMSLSWPSQSPVVPRSKISGEDLKSTCEMSESPTELRIVLLGKNGSEKSAVGNFILERGAFDPNYVRRHCERARGQVEGRHIAVINTPDLLDPHISHDKLSEELRWCVTLSKPGPHVFLLVLQPEEFTQEEGDRIRTILHTLSDRSFDYSMVLTTHEDKRGHMDEDHPLNQIVRACRGRQHLSDHTQLMADVDKIVKENGGGYLTCDVFEDTSDMVQGKEEIHRSKNDWSLKSSSGEELGKDVLDQGESAKLDNWEKI
ncbi:GTPase IMAP family member 9-like [Salvelinus sp. IW2-2015]|uniref:GTPase IMAP family member 9-like n=1 Tax=Salvelinus sp. IW2-2015 TaxID=2691554 RepID=UPI0038D4EAEB